ncbi:MAG: GtrA family protein [Acidithiobacillus sp.]|nr:GtrA family protein [Acidithiobacillus sp.]
MRSPKTEFVLFSLAGVAGFLVDASIVWAFTSAGVDPLTAQAVAFTVAVTVTWLLNRRFTFAHHASPHWLREWLHYVAANSVGAVVNNGVYALLVLTVAMFSKEPVLAVAAGSLAGLVFNFTASRALVFRPR